MTEDAKRAILELAQGVVNNKTRSHVGAAKSLAEYVLAIHKRGQQYCPVCGSDRDAGSPQDQGVE